MPQQEHTPKESETSSIFGSIFIKAKKRSRETTFTTHSLRNRRGSEGTLFRSALSLFAGSLSACINVDTTGAQQVKRGLTGEALNPDWGGRTLEREA